MLPNFTTYLFAKSFPYSAALIAALLFIPLAGHACSVEETPERSKRNVDTAAMIFEGQVLELGDTIEDGDRPIGSATIRVARIYKGAPPAIVTLPFPVGTATCGYALHPGDQMTFFVREKDGQPAIASQKSSYVLPADLPQPTLPAAPPESHAYVSGENVQPVFPVESDLIVKTMPGAINGCTGLVRLPQQKTFNSHYINLAFAPAPSTVMVDGQSHRVFNIALPLTSALDGFGPIVLTTDQGFFQSTACSPRAFAVFNQYLSIFKR